MVGVTKHTVECEGGTKDFNSPDSSLRRNSSIGLSLLTENSLVSKIVPHQAPPPPEDFIPRQVLYKADDKDSRDDVEMPPYRPFVGRGAAAAFEALRHDFYVRQHKEKVSAAPEQKGQSNKDRRVSSLGFAGAEEPQPRSWRAGMIHSEEQFEMLKLHYLNLMKEMQETALMLNLYEQHQLLLRKREQRNLGGKKKPDTLIIPAKSDTSLVKRKRNAGDSQQLQGKRQKP